jgi:predicted dehydrogenase
MKETLSSSREGGWPIQILQSPERKSSMLKIGFIDYYLDEWHANNYPAMIQRLTPGRAEVTAAYGKIASPKSGVTSEDWCAKMGVCCCASAAELVDSCDCIVVLSPDNPEMHWELCQEALSSGKPVFVDKTFSPDVKTARDLFSLAEKHHTPMYSCSSLPFAGELAELPEGEIDFVDACGPGHDANYFVHQFEPVAALTGWKALRLLCLRTAGTCHFDIEFEGGKRASFSLLGDEGAYSLTVRYTDGRVRAIPEMTGFFDRFIVEMVGFFETGKTPVPADRTIHVMAMIEAGQKAMAAPGTWVEL